MPLSLIILIHIGLHFLNNGAQIIEWLSRLPMMLAAL